MELKLKEIIEATGGRLAKGSAEALIKGVSTDSRKIAVGEAFFALRGPSFDGHSFVRDVLFKGAAAAIVDKMECAQGLQPGANIVLVDDALSALGRLASYYRGLFNIPFVAVSGSAGKTTTKEMIAAILSRSRPVLKTEGNKNNLIGLPLTLFGLEKRHEAAVVELGISEFWEMERLTDICRPDIAVLTNIGRGHLKTLGTLEGVARAKGALFAKLGPGGVRAVNLDDPWVVRLADKGGKAVTYSVKKDADVRVRDYSVDESFKGMSALYEVKGSLVPVRFSTPALTNLLNGAAAIAVVLPLDVRLKDMEEGLSSFSPVSGRMVISKVNGITLLDDTYNANPESMESALRTLAKGRGRKIAVLGDMLELGDASKEEHRQVGRLAGMLGLDTVLAIGQWSGDVAEGAASAGIKGSYGFRNKKEAKETLNGIIKEGDSVLVKGSRAVGLEEIVEEIKVRPLNKAS